MSVYKQARDAGCEYLLRQLREDGSFGDGTVGDYYKVPAAFQVCGETNAANRLCDWIRKKGMGADGDFGPRTDFTSGYFYAYFNIWVILGAQRLGQFDLAQRGMDFLMDFYDEESGGFYSSRTERSPTTMQDLWVVSGCGQAALYSSRLDVARGVGRWMQRMMDEQPDYPEVMYTVMTPGRRSCYRSRPGGPDPVRPRQRRRGRPVLLPSRHRGRFPCPAPPSNRRGAVAGACQTVHAICGDRDRQPFPVAPGGKGRLGGIGVVHPNGGAEVPRHGGQGRGQRRRAAVPGWIVVVSRFGRPQQRRHGRDGCLARRDISGGGLGPSGREAVQHALHRASDLAILIAHRLAGEHGRP